MPIYEFVCRQCTAPFEQLVLSFSAIEGVRCPECGSGDLQRKVSLFAARTGGHATGQSAGETCRTGTCRTGWT